MKRDYSLDIAKIIAMFLVAWGHFVSTGTWEMNNIPLVINGSSSLPLLPSETHSLWKLESYFFNTFHIQFPVVGVIIFFIISGMFIPYMQEKYADKSFSQFFLFTHCYKRIFPALFLSTLLVTAVEKYFQGIDFTVTQFLATATATTSLFKIPPILGVLWFLIVLEAMWLICAFIKKFTVQNIFAIYLMCLFLTLLPHINATTYKSELMIVAYNARMIGIILLGVLWTVTKDLHLVDRILYLSLAVALCLTSLKTYENLYNFSETYDNYSSYIAALCVIIAGKLLYIAVNKLPYDKFKSHFIKDIEYISGLFFPFYLCHVCIGMNTMFALRTFVLSPPVRVLLAFVSSFLIAALINKIVFGIKLLKNKLFRGIIC